MKTCAKTRKIVPLVLALLLLFGGCSAVNRAAVFGTNGNETTRRQDVLTVEFLDVGQANAALLTCGGKSPLIDGGNVADGAKVTRAVQAATDRLDYVVNTHGHEDHIGALPFVLPKLDVPVYSAKLTLGMIEGKMLEAAPRYKPRLMEVKAGETISLGVFKVTFISVCHSIPDALGIAVETPLGIVLHTGDFKFDPTPVDEHVTDYAAFAELGRKGVLLMASDSGETAGI